jgi:maltokinase
VPAGCVVVTVTALPDREVADQLMRHISEARWFAGKGRRANLRSVDRLPWLTEVTEEPAVRFEIVEIAYPPDEDPDEDTDGSAASSVEYYQLPVSYRRAPISELHHAEIGRFTDRELGATVAYDATRDPQACRLILRALLAARQLRGPDTEVRFRLADRGALSIELTPYVFTGQQSNTSVMFGDLAMAKFFRRLELGRNLDIEVHNALNAAGISDVARLYGWVEGTWFSGGQMQQADLAMVVEKLADAVDGWGLALDSLRAGESFAAEAGNLGHALAETHAALRVAFPTARVLGPRIASTMKERLTQAAAIAPDLAPYVEQLRARFDDLGYGIVEVQRVHGDFHLGQTLHTPSGWKIIDFEGEPVKSLAERAAPDSVWRDIAGMLRSFDYAAASVPGPESGAWAADCRTAFLTGYAGGPLDQADATTLRAYELDKAVYEVVYETRNRPDWVGIPLAAIATLAGAPTHPTQPTPGGPVADEGSVGSDASRATGSSTK